jgi:hypothetical protein
MSNSILFYIVQFLILGPVEARITDQLSKANVPYEVVGQVKTCAASSMPILIQRVRDDPWWGAQTVVNVWVRRTSPEQLIGQFAPGCAPAIQAANAYLRRAQAL